MNFLCLLFSTTKCTVYRWKIRESLMGGEELLHQLHTETHTTHNIRKVRRSCHSMCRRNPHLQVFQGFQTILPDSWPYLQPRSLQTMLLASPSDSLPVATFVKAACHTASGLPLLPTLPWRRWRRAGRQATQQGVFTSSPARTTKRMWEQQKGPAFSRNRCGALEFSDFSDNHYCSNYSEQLTKAPCFSGKKHAGYTFDRGDSSFWGCRVVPSIFYRNMLLRTQICFHQAGLN